MLKFGHTSRVAENELSNWLREDGPFADKDYLASDTGIAVLSALAEAIPEPILRLFEKTIGAWDPAAFPDLSRGRQSLIWSLDRIAASSGCFCRAAGVLLKLAEEEALYGRRCCRKGLRRAV